MDEETPIPFKQYFPNLTLSSFFWVIIGIAALVFGIIGYFVGIRINELPSSTSYQPQNIAQPLPTIAVKSRFGDDNDIDYSSIGGSFITNTSFYQQLVVTVDSIKDGVKTNLDTDYRYITKPQSGVQYPYSFSRLDPTKTYVVSASACAINPKTYSLICAKNIKIIGCSGKIQGSTCIITGNGNQIQSSGQVNFSITK